MPTLRSTGAEHRLEASLFDGFTVALIPHTREATLLCRRPLGAPVNLEADILAKYVAKATAYAAPGRDE